MSNKLSADPNLRLRVAGYSPGGLMRRWFFWRAQRPFWLIIAGGLCSFVLFAPYTYALNAWVLLTLAVQSLTFWGALVTARAIAKIEVEAAIVGELESRGAAYLGAVKGGAAERLELEQLEQKMLPHNASTPPPSMIRLFQHICKEAKDRRFESSVNVIQPYREEALEDIFKLQSVQKIALWLGILGTFVGLLGAIQVGDLSRGAQESGADPMSIVYKMFDNLFIAFSASLAGLEVAVILGAFLLVLRARQDAYFKSMESAVVTMLSLARNATNRDEFLVEFGQIRQSMDALKDELYQQTKELSGGMYDVRERLRQQTGQIQAGMEKLAAADSQFDGFLKHLSARQQALLDDVRSVYDSISLRNLGTTMQQHIADAGRHIASTLDPNVARIAEQIGQLNGALGGLNTVLRRQSDEHAAALNALGERLQEKLDALKSADDDRLARAWDELSQNLSALNDTLERTSRDAPRRAYVPAPRRRVRGFFYRLAAKFPFWRRGRFRSRES
jgi:predicted  nucleic acid-binding Zn-ribbon protein